MTNTTVIRVRRKHVPEYSLIKTRKSKSMWNQHSYWTMLDSIHKDCYVESEETGQYGIVVDIIREYNGIPCCLKVNVVTTNESGVEIQYYDYIPVDRVSFFEPADYISEYECYG